MSKRPSAEKDAPVDPSAVISTSAQPCPTCGKPTAPLDWDSPGFWYHLATGLLFCSGGSDA